MRACHDDIIKWKHFPRYWPFVWGIHRSPMNSPHKGQWRGALMLSSLCAWTHSWVNTRDAGDLRRNRAHYDVTVMYQHSKWHFECRPTVYSNDTKSMIVMRRKIVTLWKVQWYLIFKIHACYSTDTDKFPHYTLPRDLELATESEMWLVKELRNPLFRDFVENASTKWHLSEHMTWQQYNRSFKTMFY